MIKQSSFISIGNLLILLYIVFDIKCPAVGWVMTHNKKGLYLRPCVFICITPRLQHSPVGKWAVAPSWDDYYMIVELYINCLTRLLDLFGYYPVVRWRFIVSRWMVVCNYYSGCIQLNNPLYNNPGVNCWTGERPVKKDLCLNNLVAPA